MYLLSQALLGARASKVARILTKLDTGMLREHDDKRRPSLLNDAQIADW